MGDTTNPTNPANDTSKPDIAAQAADAAPAPEAGSGEGKRAKRSKLIAMASGEKPAETDTAGGKGDDKSKAAKPAKAAAKLGPEGEKQPGKEEPKDPKAEEAERRKERRDYAKDRRELVRREQALTAERERFQAESTTFAKRRDEEIATFKRDPLAWLKANNVNVRQVLLDAAKSDSEDPNAKLAREAKEKADALEKRLSEKEKTEEQTKAEREQAEAVAEVEADFAQAWSGVDADEYPFLTAFHDDAQVAKLATRVAIAYYQKHQRTPSASEIFGWLEKAEQARDEASQKARAKSSGKSNGDGSPRTPDRDRAVQSAGDSREQPAGRSTTQDVTSRDTRVSTTAANGPQNLRRKYEQMAGG